MKVTLDTLKPGDLFWSSFGREVFFCLWVQTLPQQATPDDDRFLTKFAYVRLGNPFIIETREWHSCNDVDLL